MAVICYVMILKSKSTKKMKMTKLSKFYDKNWINNVEELWEKVNYDSS